MDIKGAIPHTNSKLSPNTSCSDFQQEILRDRHHAALSYIAVRQRSETSKADKIWLASMLGDTCIGITYQIFWAAPRNTVSQSLLVHMTEWQVEPPSTELLLTFSKKYIIS